MSLKSFIKGIRNFFRKLFSKLPNELKKAVEFGVEITNKIKEFDANNPGLVDVLTAIIPGHWDDDLKMKFRVYLPKLLTELKLVDAALDLTDPNEIVAEAIRILKTMDSEFDIRSATLNSISILAAQLASDNKLDWNDAVYLLKWYYDHKQNNTEE